MEGEGGRKIWREEQEARSWEGCLAREEAQGEHLWGLRNVLGVRSKGHLTF